MDEMPGPDSPHPPQKTIASELAKPFRRVPNVTYGPISLRFMRPLVRHAAGLLIPDVDLSGISIETIPTPGTTVTMRVYRRVESNGSVPVVFWIHGGGYIIGDNEEDRWAKLFCDTGDVAVISAGYRLAPEHPFPAALDDLVAAVEWLRDHGAGRGLDSDRICIGGESAGGGLAAALVQQLHDAGVPMKGQLLVYPMLDDRTAVDEAIDRKEHLAWNNGSNHFGWSSYLGAEPGRDTVPQYAVPARREDLSGLPPAWIGVGDLDLFLRENTAYARRLLEADVPTAFELVEGAPHGFPSIVPGAQLSQAFTASAASFVMDVLDVDGSSDDR